MDTEVSGADCAAPSAAQAGNARDRSVAAALDAARNPPAPLFQKPTPERPVVAHPASMRWADTREISREIPREIPSETPGRVDLPAAPAAPVAPEAPKAKQAAPGLTKAAPKQAPPRNHTGRIVRVAVGLLLLGIGAAFVMDRFWTLRSNAAVLGMAEIVIRAPLEGDLRLSGLTEGDIVDRGTVLGQVVAVRPDDWRLGELRASLSLAEDEIRALSVRRATLSALIDETAEAARQFVAARMAQLDARLAENAADEQGAVGRLRESASALSRAEALYAQSAVPLAALEAAQRAQVVAQGDLAAAMQRGRALRTEREAAEKGVFLSDNNDQSGSRTSLDQLRGRLSELDLQSASAIARREALTTQVAREAERQQRASAAALAAPVRGRVAMVMARDGEFVRPGQEIAVLQDCGRPLVRVQLGEATYRALRLDMGARFSRADGTEASGRIVKLDMPRTASGELYEATVALSAGSWGTEGVQSCQAGLLGSVHFQR